MSHSIAAIILTKNEEKHIVRCLESLKGICDDIVVVDCFSEDRTEKLAVEHGARVVKHPWKNYATQFNFVCLCIQHPFVVERRAYAA